MANATGLALTAKELDGVSQPLESLEKAFRALALDLSLDLEPALEFRAERDAES